VPENYVVAAWYRFPSQCYNYFRYPSILEWSFWVKEASGEIGIYTSEKLTPQNIGIATEIASISVSVAELLVLPVCDTVSTSGLHPMLFSAVWQCRHPWKWIGHALKHRCSRWDHADIVFRRKVITTSGIRPSSWVSGWRKHRARLVCTSLKKPAP